MIRRLLCAAGLVLAAGAAVRGDPPPGVKTIHVVMHPALPPAAALRYPLLPELRYQKPGNAVPLYRKAVATAKDAFAALDDPQWYVRVDRWQELPLDRLPREQMREFLRPFDGALKEVSDASRHEYADWDLTDKLRKSGIGTLLPDMQETRQFASLLSIRVRLAAAEGRVSDAVSDLQTMFALSRHVGHAPTLISGLIGMAIANIAAKQLDALISHPSTPNLYWSLTDLPQPFLDLRNGFQGERIGAYGTFPNLPTSPSADVKPLTPEQAGMYARLLTGLQRGDSPIPDGAYTVLIALDLQRKHEKAKQALVDAGWSRAVLDKMPHIQVGVLHGFLDYERRMDESIKWCSLPYWQAAPALTEIEKRLAKPDILPRPDEPAIPIARLLLSANGRILFMRARIDRKLAALRCLEGIRLHAATHGGKLPASLVEIRDVPIPVDPYTGKPFEYTSGGDKATLFAAAHARPGSPQKANPQEALYYEIVVKK